MYEIFKYQCQHCKYSWVWRYSFTVVCPDCRKRMGFMQSVVEPLVKQESKREYEKIIGT